MISIPARTCWWLASRIAVTSPPPLMGFQQGLGDLDRRELVRLDLYRLLGLGDLRDDGGGRTAPGGEVDSDANRSSSGNVAGKDLVGTIATISGDINGDGHVDMNHLLRLAASWAKTTGQPSFGRQYGKY